MPIKFDDGFVVSSMIAWASSWTLYLFTASTELLIYSSSMRLLFSERDVFILMTALLFEIVLVKVVNYIPFKF